MGKAVDFADWAKRMTNALGQHGAAVAVAPKTQAVPQANGPDDVPDFDSPDDVGGAPPLTGGTAGGNGAGGNTAPAKDAAPGGNGAAKCVDKPGGKPAGGGGGGGKATGGGGGGGGKAAGGGGAGGGKAAGGGGKPAGTSTADGKPADGKPAAAPIPPALKGKSAKECAEFAKNAQSKLEGLEAQSKTIASASANFVTDAQSGKKAAEDAQKQADEAEKAMPPAPAVAAPTGADPKQQYESALKISADVQKIAADAYIQGHAIETQKGAAKEGQEDINRIQEASKQNAETLRTYAQQASTHASGAEAAAGQGETSAREAKEKLDKAVKEKSPDKDDLKRKADEEAAAAKDARDAAGKASTISQAIGEMSKKIEADAATVETAKTETTTIADAVVAKGDGVEIKLKPYEEAVQKAEEQEAECKSKLSEEDANAILQKRYDELGGDPALKRVLDESDKMFTTESELMRAEIKDWKNDQFRELDDMTSANKQELDQYTKSQKELQEFADREDPLSKKLKERIDKLGDKKTTERGKEVEFRQAELEWPLIEAHNLLDGYKVIIEKTEAVKTELEGRYSPIQESHDASEKYLKERRTEFDNQLEMESMSLEQKVDALEGAPEVQVKKFVGQLKTEKERIVAETVDDLKLQAQSFEPPRKKLELKPIDWSALETALAYVESKSVEELKADDSGLTKVQEAYDKAGGDAALLKKLHDEWQQKKLESEKDLQASNKRFEGINEKLRTRLNEASASEAEAREAVDQLKAHYDSAKAELDDFRNNASDLTKEQLAREKYLAREVPQLEKEYEAEKVRLSTITTNKEGIEKLMNSQKEQNDAVQDDDYGQINIEPRMGDLAAIPLRSKYKLLTGNDPLT